MIPHPTATGREPGVVACMAPAAVDTDIAVVPLPSDMCWLPAAVFDIAADF